MVLFLGLIILVETNSAAFLFVPGTFVAIQPSDTDMGSKDPLDVKIIGELYGRKA